MERKRKIVIGIIISLVLSLISLSITFASFSTTLRIDGSGKIEGSTWDIHFTKVADGDAPSGSGVTVEPTVATATSTLSTLTANSFSWAGTFNTPGDTLEYRFYVANKGDFNAALSGTFTSTVTCKINDVVQQTCPVTYTVTKDGTNGFSNGDLLNKGTSQLVVVKAQLDPSYAGSEDTIDVTTTQIVFTYTQSN